ncbi:hypothetical protein [Terrisporobacter glycolicus]|uniref:hypothetical protein n=1 Tax=Terrisporobacter glycolicus TaxID=36841 RepID=UPI001A98FB84|nr:hypothetical protein [Terrisporobacter glycolicus]
MFFLRITCIKSITKGGDFIRKYYFNDFVDDNSRHEIHAEGCPFLPYYSSRTYIGYLSNCEDALRIAKYQHPLKSFVCCKSCCKLCPNSCLRC